MNKVRALIITGFGINCEEEMAAAYQLADAQTQIAHLNELLHEKVSIHDFDIVNFPGGFSFGDDIASGRVMANKVRFKKLLSGSSLLEELIQFIQAGKFILGVCNGFQILVKLGLLPNSLGNQIQETSLIHNDSAQFENRWCWCKVNTNCPSPFLKNIDKIYLPVRHGEGKLIIKEESIKKEIKSQHLNCLTYCDETGTPTSIYPQNPNGSDLNCAALCDPSGQVFGLMPHPEAYLSLYNHPNWGQIKRHHPNISEEGEGLQIFKNIVQHISEKVAIVN